MENMNSGYVGWSMSRRAVAAYDRGEMPKSKWTKAAMLDAIAECCEEFGLSIDEDLSKCKKDDLWWRFFEWKSWHHTGKYCNETDFYGVSERAVFAAAGE